MRRISYQIVFAIGMSILCSAEKEFQHRVNGFEYDLIEKKLSFENPGYELEQFDRNGLTLTRPILEHSGSKASPGEPDLPSISTYYMVQPGKKFNVGVSAVHSNVIENVNLAPFDSWEPDADGQGVEGDVYYQNELFPSTIVTVSEPIVFRDITMVQVTIIPFQYNPTSKELKVIQSVDIDLLEDGDTEAPFIPAKPSIAFESLYRSLVVNYPENQRNRNEDYQKPAILYVLPNNIGNLFNTIEQLMDWKKRVGFDVQYVSSSTVVNNRNNLKNYIQNAYQSWDNPPVYVNIVGDATGSYDIPTWTESWSGYNGEGDMPYTQLEGGDVFPEVFIGRISFSTSSHLNTIVSKTLNYESNPYMNENWFQRACLVGDASTSGVSCVITNEHIHELLELADFQDVNTIYGGSFPSQMVSGLNDGVSFYNYRGYYGVSGFDGSDVNSTSNGFMLPVATVITCGTGSFADGSESLMESFIRAGTSSNPKGSVVCIGTATLGTHTMFNNMVDMGFYYGAMISGIETPSAALMYGKMMLYQNYPSNPNNYAHIFTHWNNLMGEASLQMWTSYPKVTDVSHPYALTKGTNFIDISVQEGNEPVENAWVTILMDGQIFESRYTNAQGSARIPVTSSQTGEVLITVTKKNHYPYQSSFQIYDPGVAIGVGETPFLLDDDMSGNSSGNSDMIANGGETLELYVSASNYGSEDAVNVLGTLHSTSNHVEYDTTHVLNFGDIAPGESVTSPLPFVISLNEGLSDATDLGLTVMFTDDLQNVYSSMLDINVAGNELKATGIDVLGTTNDYLIPGQSSYVKLVLSNTGSTNASSVTGTIACASPFVEILDHSGTWSTVYSGASTMNETDYFEISTLEETIPGTVAHLIVNIETSEGYISNSIIEIQIGAPTVNDPVGPDSYGYYIYDNQDVNYTIAPTYNWVEIDARLGGPGTHLSSLTDNGDNQDDTETITLPFTFTFYGREYNEISISSNGWIAMGETDLESFRNYQVPGVGGPAKMIAVFWDDLQLTSGGRVYTWHDQIEKKFYIEWSEVRTFQNNSLETFQAVLFDPSYYVTPTGDGEVLMQYKDFNNTSYGSYSWDQIHGDYCTVGIEDHTMTRGLQYTFNNTYHPAAMPLNDDRSILITTRGSNIRMEGDLNYDERIDVFDLMLMVDYNLGYEGQVNPYFGDINDDGMINVMDLIYIIRLIMGYG